MWRLPDWEQQYISNAQAEIAKPFDWVDANCGNLVACSIRACCGDHPILSLLAKYDSQEAVQWLLESNGGLEGIFSKYFAPIPTSYVTQADIGIYHDGTGAEVGSIILDGVAVAKTNRGVHRFKPARLSLAFRVCLE